MNLEQLRSAFGKTLYLARHGRVTRVVGVRTESNWKVVVVDVVSSELHEVDCAEVFEAIEDAVKEAKRWCINRMDALDGLLDGTVKL